jgi:PAS domain S-box-containing protein
MADFASSGAGLQHNDGFYRSLFENLLNGCAYCRMLYKNGKPDDFVYLAVNDAFGALTGLKDVVGKRVSEVIPNIQETDFQLIETYGRVAREGKPERFEVFLEALKMWLLISVYCPKQDHFVAVFDVITESKQTEMTLQKITYEMQRLLDTSATGLARLNRDLNYITVNSAYAKLTGMPQEQIIGNSLVAVIGENRFAAITPYIERVLNGERVEYEIGVPFKLSGARHLHTVFTPYEDDLGDIIGWVASVTDITERKQAEDKLREREESLRFFFQYAPAALAMFDTTMHYIYASKRWLSDYRLEYDDLIGRSHYEVFPEITDELKAVHQRGLAGEVVRKDNYRFERADGTVQWLCWEVRPWFKVSGVVGGIVIFTEDITERKRAEEDKQAFEQQLQQTQKLESLGVLSGGIAHDFNNILAIILGYCSLTRRNYETAGKYIPKIENAVERAAGLCRQMMAYAGKAEIKKAKVNLWTLVDEMLAMMKATLPQNAEIKPDLSADNPYVIGDVSQIRQIVMNLIINASEAIGTERGEVRVLLANETVTTYQPVKDYNGKVIPAGEYVCLEVTDNGCGMDEETKWRVFEPFFTTKFSGRGLGMSATLGIINSHNGALQLFSQLGQGTTFKMYLPASSRAEDGNADSTVPSAKWQGSGTVLLVEDEDQVRDIAKTYLETFGFTVLEAVNGKEALELYKTNAAEINLVVTDIGMPVMDGYELCAKLKSLNQKLPIIISSGFGDTDVTSRIESGNIAGIISKPYTPNQIMDVLKGVVKAS